MSYRAYSQTPSTSGAHRGRRLGAWLILLFCYLIDLPRRITFGSVSLGGLSTVAVTAAAIFVAITLLRIRKDLLPVLALGIAFLCFAGSGLVVRGFSGAGPQNYCVYVLFVFSVLLGASLRGSDRGWVLRQIQRAALFVGVLGLVNDVLISLGSGFWGRRSHALEAIILSAVAANIPFRSKILTWTSVSSLLLSALLSGSRTGTATIAGILLLSWSVRARGWRRAARFLCGVLAAGAMFGALLIFVPAARERMAGGDKAVRVGEYTLDTEGRNKFWKDTWDLFLRSPIVGNGTGSADDAISVRYENIGHPHNDYLRFLADNGIIGLALWLSLVAVLFRKLLRARTAASADLRLRFLGAAAFLGVLAAALTDNVHVYAFAMGPLGLLLGLGISVEATSQVAVMALEEQPRFRSPGHRRDFPFSFPTGLPAEGEPL